MSALIGRLPTTSAKTRAWLGVGLAGVAFAALLWLFAQQAWWGAVLGRLFPEQRSVLYGRNTLLELTLQHLVIVGAALALILVIGIPLGVWLTRPSGRALRLFAPAPPLPKPRTPEPKPYRDIGEPVGAAEPTKLARPLVSYGAHEAGERAQILRSIDFETLQKRAWLEPSEPHFSPPRRDSREGGDAQDHRDTPNRADVDQLERAATIVRATPEKDAFQKFSESSD